MKTASLSAATAKPSPEAAEASASGQPSGADRRIGVRFMLLSVGCFTANTLLLKYLGSIRGVDFSLALLTRALLGVVIVFFFFNSRRPLEMRAAITDPRLVLRGLLGVAGTAAFYWTVPELGAGKATLIGTTYALFGTLFAAIFLRERLSRGRVAALLTAFAGIALLTGSDMSGGAVFGFAELVALAGALSAGWVVGLIRQLTTRYSNSTIYFSQCFWIGLTVAPLACFRSAWPGWEGVGFLAVGAVAAGYGQIALVQGFRHLEVATGSSIQMGLPVMASLGGFLLFGESFSLLQIAGAALTLLGTWRVVTAKH